MLAPRNTVTINTAVVVETNNPEKERVSCLGRIALEGLSARVEGVRVRITYWPINGVASVCDM